MKLSNTLLAAAAVATSMISSVALGSVAWPGPDAFGYSGVKTSGNTFPLIKGNGGTLITPADPAAALYDDWWFTIPVGFTFNFYGVPSTNLFVTVNGFVAFGGTTNTVQTLGAQVVASYTNGSLDSAAAIPTGSNLQVDRQIICPWWDDMQFTSGAAGGLYYKNQTVGGVTELIIEWNGVGFFNSTANPVTFQLVLRSDNTISFNYVDVVSSGTGTNGASATIGIHDLAGTNVNNRYLQYSFNTAAAVASGDKITISPTPSGVCCRGSTCNASVAQASCLGNGLAGAAFVSSTGTCNTPVTVPGTLGNTTTPCCYANYNKANGIEVQDIFDFLNDWLAGSKFALVGGNGTTGTLDVQNIFDFLNSWFAGGC